MGKNHCKQVIINMFLPINHTGMQLDAPKYCRQPPQAELEIKMAAVEDFRGLGEI